MNDVAGLPALLAAPRILVIDDNDAIHQDFRKIFGASHERPAPSAAELALFGGGAAQTGVPEFRIDFAYQGQEGLELVRLAQEQQNPYAMAFVDVRMPPGWDGIETTARIWQQDPDIQVVICTAFSDYSWSEMLAKLGRSDRLVILKKPFDTIEVVQLASALTEKWRLARQSRSVMQNLEHRVTERTIELRASEQRFRSLTALSSDWFWEQDEKHRFRSFSGGDDVEGWGPDQSKALGLHRWDLGVVPISSGWEEHKGLMDAHKPFRNFEYQRNFGDGRLQYVEASGEPVFAADGRFTGYCGVATDITQRKLAEARIIRLNRVYAVLSGINSAIVRNQERDALFEEVCRIAVSDGGFMLSRVVELDTGGKARVAANTGSDSGVFQKLVDEYNGNPEDSESLLALALRVGKPMISNDVASDPRIPRRAELTQRGTYALALLPIIVEQRVAGAFILRAQEAGMFDEKELQLLLEVTSNLSFALEHIEKKKKVQRLTRVYAVLSGINTLIVRVRNREELFREACRIAVDDGGFLVAWLGIIDRSVMKIIPAASAGDNRELINAVNDLTARSNGFELSDNIAARSIKTKKAIVSNDSQNDPELAFGDIHARTGIRSMAVLPLLAAGQALGALALYSAELGFFDDEEMKLLTELAGDIGFAIAHLKRAKKLARVTRINAVLSGINALIVRARDRDELFGESCRIAVEAGAFAKVWIGTMDPASRQFRMVAAHGGDPLFFQALERELAQKYLAGRGLSARAVATLQPVVSNDTASDPEVLLKGDVVAGGVRSIAILPLVVAGTAVGVLALNADTPGFFDAEEMTLLAELARNIAFAIDHIGKQEELDYLAYYDALTGLANRRLFLERVSLYMRAAVSGGHKLALFFLDLERFRNINDSLGRPAGDALLKQVATWLTQSVGDANILARLGADHFAIVLPEVKQAGDLVHLLDKRIREFNGHPFRLENTEIRLAAKVGVALFPNDGTDADNLLRNAEAALKRAKSSGARYLFYTQEMTARVAETLALENQLRQALDKGEFVLHYQPKVNLASGKLTGAEALIRWNDPRTGLVPPGKFIPILEETGLIHDVGRWALRQAIEQYLRWRAAGLPAVRIAVNVSALQLRNRGFVAEVQQAIGIDANAAAGLELEITESLIMDDVKNTIVSLQAIRAMGVSIAIDDFGTGFSSLSYLAKLPVDTLKIDRSFVTGMTAGPDGLALVTTIINLAHSLKLKVVAEGVETDEQAKLLRLLHCDEMQGFLFSKPVPGDIFESKFLIEAAILT